MEKNALPNQQRAATAATITAALNKPINLVKNGKSISFLAFIVITKPSEQLKRSSAQVEQKSVQV